MTEREQFEAWANGTGFSTNRQDNDNYLYSATRGAWEAWQAARYRLERKVDAIAQHLNITIQEEPAKLVVKKGGQHD